MEFLQAHQLNFMLVMSGICGTLTVLTLMIKALTFKRRCILAALEASAMLLLVFDRFAYLYHGNTSAMGFWMVRISNFLVYFLSLYLSHSFTRYLRDLYENEGGMTRLPKRLLICEAVYGVGVALVIISQFTGLYYTFDAQNAYQRAPGNFICFAIPILILLLQLTLIIQYRSRLHRAILLSLIIYTVTPLVASLIQYFCYGISLINMMLAATTVLLYVYALIDLNNALDQAHQREIEFYKEEQKREHTLFEQTAEALVNAIDAKDRYTNGHSKRVAEYSRKIARQVGKSEDECEEIYFAALLHDVGKIGVPAKLLNKKGRLTDEEFTQVKNHPVVGGQILSSIQQSPFLSIAARYHHERYDGKGYPEGLMGEDIPEVARIVAVADAYDTMTSNRSYRKAIPQHIAREELVKGIETQFDPAFAKAMIHLLDLDTEYQMREMETNGNLSPATSLRCETIYRECTEGIPVTPRMTLVRLFVQPDKDCPGGMPTLLLFDALDGRVHPGEENNKDLLYYEYARIRLDGQVEGRGVRKVETRVREREPGAVEPGSRSPRRGKPYDILAVRTKDHAMVRIVDDKQTIEVILALPDCSRFVYVSVTGENCTVNDIHVEHDENPVDMDYIPRIAEEISFIRGCPQGDVPNIQIDNWRSEATNGIPIQDGLTLTFHTMSLPTARLVWHCPFISVFSSSDGQVNGANFREFILLRLDGENWESDNYVENQVTVNRAADFAGWNAWKEKNRQGMDCTAVIRRQENRITMQTENLGIAIHSVTTIRDDVKDVYVALTGDQCAITNIRVLRGE